LKLAGLWVAISSYYERLPEKNWMHAKILTAEEEDRFFRFAAIRPGWRTAYNSARLTSNSTISGCELRMPATRSATPDSQHCRGGQKQAPVRAVPLNDTALSAIRDLLVLARERGSVEPDHYLIAYRRKKATYVPERPASPYVIRTAFRACGRCRPIQKRPFGSNVLADGH
jgi:hypothetical protein